MLPRIKKRDAQKSKKVIKMKIRTITSCVILAVMVPILLLSEYLIYPFALALFSLAAVFELLRAIGVHKEWKISLPAYFMALALPFFTHDIFLDQNPEIQRNYMLDAVAVTFGYMLYIMALAVFSKGKLKLSVVAEVYLAVTYVVISFTALCLLRYIRYGDLCFFLVFVAAWGTDSGAYVAGTLFGKHKLIPEISPKKTVEGAIGGIFLSTLVFIIYGICIEQLTDVDANYFILTVSGILLSVVAQIGDLIASLIKREHGIKNYGNILPGHGGIMDRFDSILAVSTPLIMLCLICSPFK